METWVQDKPKLLIDAPMWQYKKPHQPSVHINGHHSSCKYRKFQPAIQLSKCRKVTIHQEWSRRSEWGMASKPKIFYAKILFWAIQMIHEILKYSGSNQHLYASLSNHWVDLETKEHSQKQQRKKHPNPTYTFLFHLSSPQNPICESAPPITRIWSG